MAKKRFTEGMESLFGGGEGYEREKLTLFPPEETVAAGAQSDDHRKSNKGFAASLDAFLAEAFESLDRESAEDGETAAEAETTARTQSRPRGRRPGSGLDLLIRQTSEQSQFVPQQHDTRRVTLIFNKEHLEKLKTIARRRNTYLKDVIGEIVDRYLRRYESEKE